MPAVAPPPAPDPPRDALVQMPPRSRVQVVALGIVLALAVYLAGAPGLDAPWIQGDEFIFIAHNSDVNAEPATLGARLRAIFTKIHDDLYQPLPIASYALEWTLAGPDAAHFRRTDLLLHVCNALLLWWVLASLLRRLSSADRSVLTVVAWGAALIWAVHPVLITAYAADMGRTHLLSATFALLALEMHLLALTPGGGAWFIVSLAALLAAMLSKAIPGWVLVAFALEATLLGWHRTIRSPRVWGIGVVCVAFAGLTIWTSRQSGLMEDASKGLFGDPVARSALAVWLYARNVAVPAWLSFWYLPDPRTGWAFAPVWLGLLLTAASALHIFLAARRPAARGALVGWAWCWGLLLPVIGLVGAREAAATDRYLYQPLMGGLLVIGLAVAGRLARLRPAQATRVVLPVAAIVGLAMVLWDLPHVRLARSCLGRGTRVAHQNPGDPRALEALAAAYDFARNHPVPADDLAEVRAGTSPYDYFTRRARETLAEAAACGNLAHYFPSPEDRGPFHRRLSYRFLLASSPEQALAQAQEAEKLLPAEFLTWKRLAHAYQALGRLPEAAAAYEKCEQYLPDRPETRVAHLTDYASLLLFDLDREAEACPRFEMAVKLGNPPAQAKIGLALCMIRDPHYGTGAEGFALVREVLQADPSNTRAGLVLAEYHLRSHHWREAALVYQAILHDHPTQYTALRGFHEVCLQLGQPTEAAIAWQDALRRSPGDRGFESYLVWALALADDPATEQAANALLAREPDNPFACYSLMLAKARQKQWRDALGWARHAVQGQPVPRAREPERAAAAVQLLIARQELPAEAIVVQGAVMQGAGFSAAARQQVSAVIEQMAASTSDGEAREAAGEVLPGLSDAGSRP